MRGGVVRITVCVIKYSHISIVCSRAAILCFVETPCLSYYLRYNIYHCKKNLQRFPIFLSNNWKACIPEHGKTTGWRCVFFRWSVLSFGTNMFLFRHFQYKDKMKWIRAWNMPKLRTSLHERYVASVAGIRAMQIPGAHPHFNTMPWGVSCAGVNSRVALKIQSCRSFCHTQVLQFRLVKLFMIECADFCTGVNSYPF